MSSSPRPQRIVPPLPRRSQRAEAAADRPGSSGSSSDSDSSSGDAQPPQWPLNNRTLSPTASETVHLPPPLDATESDGETSQDSQTPFPNHIRHRQIIRSPSRVENLPIHPPNRAAREFRQQNPRQRAPRQPARSVHNDEYSEDEDLPVEHTSRIWKLPHYRPRRILLSRENHNPMATVTMRGDVHFYPRRKEFRLLGSLPQYNKDWIVEDAVMLASGIGVVAYSKPEGLQAGLISMVRTTH